MGGRAGAPTRPVFYFPFPAPPSAATLVRARGCRHRRRPCRPCAGGDQRRQPCGFGAGGPAPLTGGGVGGGAVSPARRRCRKVRVGARVVAGRRKGWRRRSLDDRHGRAQKKKKRRHPRYDTRIARRTRRRERVHAHSASRRRAPALPRRAGQGRKGSNPPLPPTPLPMSWTPPSPPPSPPPLPPAASQPASCGQPASCCFTMSLVSCGSARPPDAARTLPTKKPNSLFLPCVPHKGVEEGVGRGPATTSSTDEEQAHSRCQRPRGANHNNGVSV